MNFKKIFIALFAVANVSTGVYANTVTYMENESITTIMEGLRYKELTQVTNEGFLDVYILEYDMNNEKIDIDILRNKEEWAKRTKLTEMMTDSKVLAGVNASFFDTSDIYSDVLGMEYEDGLLVYAKNNYNKTEAKSNSLNLHKNGNITFDYISNTITFISENGASIYVNSVNGVQDFNNPTVFTGNVIKDTAPYDIENDIYKVIIEDGVVTKIFNPKESILINENEIALITKDYYIVENLPIGSTVNYSVDTNFGDFITNFDLVLSGGGTILKDTMYISDGMQVYPNKNAPRTAIGTTLDGRLISIVVDGRGSSIGATYEDVATFLLEEGVTDAITLDGGGSSEIATINHNNAVVIKNTPSDNKERNILNGLGFVSNVPEEERILSEISIKLPDENLFLGNSSEVLLMGYDQYKRPYYLDNSIATYTIDGIDANIYNNSITPLHDGIGLIKATVNDLEATTFINVTKDAKDINVEPYYNELYINQSVPINSTVTDYENNTMNFSLNDASFVFSRDDMGYIMGDTFYSTGLAGELNIEVSYSGITKNIYLEVLEESTITEDVEVIEEISSVLYIPNSYSVKDDNYIAQENTYGLQEISSFGMIEILEYDDVDTITNKINELTQNSFLRLFSGGISTPKAMNLLNSNLFDNTINYTDYYELNTKVVNLETFTSDSYNINQLMELKTILDNNYMKNVIIQYNDKKFNATNNTRFNKLLLKTLDEYGQYGGQNIYLINGNTARKNISVNNLGDTTYIEMPKTNISLENIESLNNGISFYLDNDILKYSFKN